jgi:hypothetical protein
MYLFDPADTLDKVDRESLVPLARAAARIIEGTAGLSPDSFRRIDPVVRTNVSGEVAT